jgi:hypothetical protein
LQSEDYGTAIKNLDLKPFNRNLVYSSHSKRFTPHLPAFPSFPHISLYTSASKPGSPALTGSPNVTGSVNEIGNGSFVVIGSLDGIGNVADGVIESLDLMLTRGKAE